MKLIVRDYLASLKEREELDAILPDLLSELGYTVISRPRRGTAQQGVDIAAVGTDEDGKRKLFLFSVKQGDLTRQDWDGGTPQSLRPSLNEILDGYIPTRIPARYKSLPIVICLCIGGDVHENIRTVVSNFEKGNSSKRVSFDEWNGDKLAELILRGVLREKFLPKSLRASFQKSVAMVDEPDVAFGHFANLLESLRSGATANFKARVRTIRQLNICLWILFVWAREVGNVEAPYRASELSLLLGWELLKPTIGKRSAEAKAMSDALHELIQLHLRIGSHHVEKCLLPYAKIPHGLSSAVRSGSALDVNRKMFDQIGRLGLMALWISWVTSPNRLAPPSPNEHVTLLCQTGIALIQNNPVLFLPISDDQAIDVSLFLQAWIASGLDAGPLCPWLTEMVGRLDFAVRTQTYYPAVFSDYRELSGHPRERTEDYFENATAGSTLIPILACWLAALKLEQPLATLSRLVGDKVSHTNLQLWLPDAASEERLYLGSELHGRALSDLNLGDDGRNLFDAIRAACAADDSFSRLSAHATGFWPIILVACRHHRLPIPPQFWIGSLAPSSTEPGDSSPDAPT